MPQHPKALYICSLGEVFNRFAYYGLQATLVLYVVHVFFFNNLQAYSAYGVLTTLAFCLPVLGGFITDRVFGARHSIFLGIVLTIIGALALCGTGSRALYMGLTLLIIGIGFFKPANAALLGVAYQHNPSQRESGFTLFYLAMNLGAILGPVVFGVLALRYGWRSAFIGNAAATFICLLVYVINKPSLTSPEFTKNKTHMTIAYGIIIGIIILVFLLFQFHWLFEVSFWTMCLCLITWMVLLAKQLPAITRNRLFLLLLLDLFAVFYFACQMQVGSSLMIFIDQYVHLKLFGYTIPAAVFAALEPVFVILTAPLLSPCWNLLSKQNIIIPPVARLAGGLLLGSASFWVLSYSSMIASISWLISGIVIGNALLGAGELCIGPTLTSAVTYLVPQKLTSTFMGVWFLSVALSGYLGSVLARLTETSQGIGSFQGAFQKISLIGFVAALILLAISPYLKYLRSEQIVYAETPAPYD